MDHPYIVHFEHYFEDAEFVYIMLEKCSNQVKIVVYSRL